MVKKWRRSGAKLEFYGKWSLSRKARTDIRLAKSLVKLRLILFDGVVSFFEFANMVGGKQFLDRVVLELMRSVE
jgi:hypothetical protein